MRPWFDAVVTDEDLGGFAIFAVAVFAMIGLLRRVSWSGEGALARFHGLLVVVLITATVVAWRLKLYGMVVLGTVATVAVFPRDEEGTA